MPIDISNQQIITSLVQNITREIEQRGWSIMRLSEEADIPYDTIKKLLSGKIQNPHLCNIAKISYALNIDMNTLSGLTEHSMQVMQTRHTNNMIYYLLELEKSLMATKKYQNNSFVPVFIPLSTSHNSEYYSDSIGVERMPTDAYESTFGHRISYGIKIRTNTYHPVYFQNDILMIARDRAPVSGETGIFIQNNRLFIRRFIVGNPITLEPINSIGSTITIPSLRNWVILGYVLGVYR